jgi:hypothetical protein
MSLIKKWYEEFIVDGKLCFVGEEISLVNAPPERGWFSESEMIDAVIQQKKVGEHIDFAELDFHVAQCRYKLRNIARRILLMNSISEKAIDVPEFNEAIVKSLHESILINAANVYAGTLWLASQQGAKAIKLTTLEDIRDFLTQQYNATQEETGSMVSPLMITASDCWPKLMFQKGRLHIFSSTDPGFQIEDVQGEVRVIDWPQPFAKGNGVIRSIPYFLVLLLQLSKIVDVVCKYYVIQTYNEDAYLSAHQSLQKAICDGEYQAHGEPVYPLREIYEKYFSELR